MYKIDFHTHSIASPDGGITRKQYQKALHTGLLDYIAVTDHNQIHFAQLLQQEFGDRIIVGEEIMTTEGEIVGLYLEDAVKPGQTPQETVAAIKAQGGLVYIPHPFETVRKGLQASVLDEIAEYIDLIEICNGRALMQNRSAQAAVWSRLARKIGAASSDAHGYRGLGKTYTLLSEPPTRDNLLKILESSSVQAGSPGVRAVLYPTLNRLRKRMQRQS